MTIAECYAALGGNYEEAIGRLMMPALVERFALKFLNDKSFAELSSALSSGLTEDAFHAAHTLKGVCANLAFTRLTVAASAITEQLRVGDINSARTGFAYVEAVYESTIAVLKKYQAEKAV